MRLPPLSLLLNILRTAARVDNAVGGILQVADGGTLRMAAHHGLPPAFVEHFEVTAPNDGSACGQAFHDRRRIVIRDLAADAGYAPHFSVASAAGLRAVQSTPLVDGRRKLVGVLSTYFLQPHHPSPDGLARIDACCSVAARLVEAHRLADAIATTDQRLGMTGRSLSPVAAQAADAAQLLLRGMHRSDGHTLLEVADRHLAVITGELTALFARYKRTDVERTALH